MHPTAEDGQPGRTRLPVLWLRANADPDGFDTVWQEVRDRLDSARVAVRNADDAPDQDARRAAVQDGWADLSALTDAVDRLLVRLARSPDRPAGHQAVP